jgi:hypothetical protein
MKWTKMRGIRRVFVCLRSVAACIDVDYIIIGREFAVEKGGQTRRSRHL